MVYSRVVIFTVGEIKDTHCCTKLCRELYLVPLNYILHSINHIFPKEFDSQRILGIMDVFLILWDISRFYGIVPYLPYSRAGILGF